MLSLRLLALGLLLLEGRDPEVPEQSRNLLFAGLLRELVVGSVFVLDEGTNRAGLFHHLDNLFNHPTLLVGAVLGVNVLLQEGANEDSKPAVAAGIVASLSSAASITEVRITASLETVGDDASSLFVHLRCGRPSAHPRAFTLPYLFCF